MQSTKKNFVLVAGFCLIPLSVAAVQSLSCESLRLILLLWQKIPQRQIIHDILNVLDPVLQAVATAA
jgi:hypothetical protein